MCSIMWENSCNSNWLLTLLLCLLFSLDLSSLRTLHWTPFKCFGSTLLWILSPPLLLPLNHQLIIFLKENQWTKMMPSWAKLCGETSLDMLFIKLLFWSSLSSLVKELLLPTILMNASILLKQPPHHQSMNMLNATLTNQPVLRLPSITHSTPLPSTWMKRLSVLGAQSLPSKEKLPHYNKKTSQKHFLMNSVVSSINKNTLIIRKLAPNWLQMQMTGRR